MTTVGAGCGAVSAGLGSGSHGGRCGGRSGSIGVPSGRRTGGGSGMVAQSEALGEGRSGRKRLQTPKREPPKCRTVMSVAFDQGGPQ